MVPVAIYADQSPNGLPVIVGPDVAGTAAGRVGETDDLLLEFIVQSFFEF